MDNMSLSCSICCVPFWSFVSVKRHMFSKKHMEKMKEVFHKEKFHGHSFPHIVIMNKHKVKQSVIGVSLLTCCFSSDISAFFYLCHVCEDKCLPRNIVGHLASRDHYSNYFAYMNPNILSYSWIPSMSMKDILRHEISKEIKKEEMRRLQMLDSPKELLEKLLPCTYSQAMQSLSENHKLLKLLEAVEPKRVMLGDYQKDSTREHPLLGMQHIVECICVGMPERRHYLCTLCNLTVSTHMVIRHILSFDHIYGYFKAWHPSTLLSKESYTDHSAFASIILDLAKEAEKIQGAANTDFKQVQLEPAEYSAVNFACYKEALKELESIWKKKEGSSLVTVVTPGQKLGQVPVDQCRPQSPVQVTIRCQECNMHFDHILRYINHLSTVSHRKLLREYFGEENSSFKHGGTLPLLKLYSYLKENSGGQTAIGISLVVMCISSETKDEPVCVCFACSECFLDSSAKTHLTSQKHIINTLLYLNPWRLPLGWVNFQDLSSLELAAKEEEEERGLHHKVMKILDIPPCMLNELKPPSYGKVLKTLKQRYTRLKCGVPPPETRTKTKDNERFPLLGREFLVKFNVAEGKCPITEAALLCLLCNRRVSSKENYAHVFGREHIQQFISYFHPGSLHPDMDVETLLDLAKQALRHHPVLNIQEIELGRPIQAQCKYGTAFGLLQAEKQRQGKGQLRPRITPKMQLFPRGSLKDTEKKPVKDNNPAISCKVETSEQKEPESTDLPVVIKVEVEGNITPSAESTEQEVDLKSLTPNDKDPVKTVKEEIKGPGETCETVKKEDVEMPVFSEASDEKTVGYEYRKNDLSSKDGLQCSKNLTNVQNFLCKEEEVETLISMCKESEDTGLHDVSGTKMSLEQNRFVTEAQSLLSGNQEKEIKIKEEEETMAEEEEEDSNAERRGGNTSQQSVKNKALQHQHRDQLWQYIEKTNREPVIGLDALLECCFDQHKPIYLCKCCSVKIREKDIIKHVSGVNHHRKYLLGHKDFPNLRGEVPEVKIRNVAALYEKQHGYGEAQVFDVDEDDYQKVLTQDFWSALSTVRAQQNNGKLRLSSGLFTVRPVDTSLIPEPLPELSSVQDNYQSTMGWHTLKLGHGNLNAVMDMEIEGSLDDFEENLSSMTKIKTPKVAPDSSEYVKIPLDKESHLAHNTYCCQSVVKSEEAASACVSTRGTNTTCIQPDFRQTDIKLEVSSDTAVVPKQEEKDVVSSQDAETSDKVVTTSTKAMTAVSERTAKASSSAPGSFNKTAAPIPRHAFNTSSCTAAKSGISAASTSSTSAATYKPSTANSRALDCKSSTTNMSAGDANCGSTTTKHIKEAVYKCTSSTHCAFVTTNQLNPVNLKTSTSTTASADNNRVITHKYVTSTTGASAATKPTGRKPATNTTTIPTASTTNRGSQTTSSGCILTTTKSSTTLKHSTSRPSHCATTRESMTANHSTITSTNKSAAPTSSCNATKTKSRDTAYKCATSLICASATSTKPTGVNQRTSTSKTTSTSKLEQVSKPIPGKTEVSTKAKIKPRVEREASCRSPSVAISQAVVSSVAADAELSVKYGKTKATSKTPAEETSVGSNTDVTQNNSSTPAIGLNYGIKVSCGGRLQVYCRLCSSRLRRAGHFRSFRHKYNYVKMKFPTWTARKSEMKSKLDKIVAKLAEIEKDMEPKDSEILEVDLSTYKELGDPLLPVDKAFEKLMEKMSQKDSGVSSSTVDPVEGWTPDTLFSNSPEVLSPDDEMCFWQNEAVGLHPEIQSENTEEIQAKIEESAVPGDEGPLAAEQSDTSERTLDLKAEPIAVTENHHLTQEAKAPQSSMAPQTFNSRPSSITQTAEASQEVPEKISQLQGSKPEKKVTTKKQEDPEKSSPAKYSNPGKLLSTASVDTGQQDQPRSGQTVEQERAKCRLSSRPELDCAPQVLLKTPIGDMSGRCSNLSTFLTVKRLDSQPIIGLGAVWECRGLQQKTFYLCTSCSERLLISDICKHMISDKHQLNHMHNEYSRLTEFCKMNNLQPEVEQNIFREVVTEVSKRERELKKDAQCVLLPQDWFEYVKTAPFSEALKFLQDFTANQKLSVPCPPSSALLQKDQLSGEDQSQVGSRSTEMQPAHAPEADKTSDNVGQETEEQRLDETIQKEVLSPAEKTEVCSEAGSYVAQAPEADTYSSPQETSSNHSEHSLPLSQPVTGLRGKPTELCPESQSFSPSSNDGPNVGPVLPVFTGDKSLLTRKRLTDISVEALSRSCTGNPQVEGPFPFKRTCSSPHPITKSAPEPCFVPPVESDTLLSAGDKSAEPASETCKGNITFDDLIALVMEKKSEKKMSPCKAAQPYSLPSTASSTNPSEDVNINLSPKFELTPVVPAKKKKWDIEPHLGDTPDGTSLPSATTADSREQQIQVSGDAQSMSGQMNSFNANPISEDTGYIQEPKVTSEPVNKEVSQLPINAIVTSRLDHRQWQLLTNSNMQGYTAGNSQTAHSLTSAETMSHSNTQAASAGYDQTTQTAYATNGHSYYPAPGNAGGFTTSYPPFAYTPSAYQGGAYITSGAYQRLGWMEVMRLRYMQHQRYIQQQQLYQHQHMYPPSMSAAAASTGTYGTVYQGASHPSSQQLTNFPQYEQVQHQNNTQQP